MFRLLIDTSVWLDLAKDYREQPVISALEDLVAAGEIQLIVPQIVVDEFNRNKTRVVDEARRSLQSHFRLVREAVNRFGTDEYRTDTLKALNEVDHRIVTGNEAVIDSVDRIEKLLTMPPIATSAAIKQRVTDRAIAGLAPYHRSKNSVGDAILIETYSEASGRRTGKKTRFGFVTHNSKDFSEPNGDRRKPHPDIAALFKPPKSTYWGVARRCHQGDRSCPAGGSRQRVQLFPATAPPVGDPRSRTPAVPAGIVQQALESPQRNRKRKAQGSARR
jgi:hypothetical protein